jgi:hypothetical protein
MITEDVLWSEVVRLVTRIDPVPDGLVERVQRRVSAEMTRATGRKAA